MSEHRSEAASEHINVGRVRAAASEFGLDLAVKTFPEGTKTAGDAAAAIGVEVGQIVKSLVFGIEHNDGSVEVVMAFVSGSNQLSEALLAAAAGAVKCRRMDADAVRAATGYAIGGVPPFGHSTVLRRFADPDLLVFDEVWAAAGTGNDVFGVDPRVLIEVTDAVVVPLRRQ